MLVTLKATLKRYYLIMLCNDFTKLSKSVWHLLKDARTINYQIKEETVTDLLMLNIKGKHEPSVKIKTFTRQEEKQNGSDWEWWFLDSSTQKGIGFRVQAKILNLKQNKFLQLYYQNQNQNLISEAQKPKIKLFPLYCLYIHDDKLLSNVYGCSIMSAYEVQKLKKSKIPPTLSNLMNSMIPWNILVCDCKKTNINTSLPNRLWKILKNNGFYEEDNESYHLPNDGELPNYVKKMINQNVNYQSEDEELHLEGLDGIMVIIDYEPHNNFL